MTLLRPATGRKPASSPGAFCSRYSQRAAVVRTAPPLASRRCGKRRGKTQQGTTANGRPYLSAASTISSVASSACSPTTHAASRSNRAPSSLSKRSSSKSRMWRYGPRPPSPCLRNHLRCRLSNRTSRGSSSVVRTPLRHCSSNARSPPPPATSSTPAPPQSASVPNICSSHDANSACRFACDLFLPPPPPPPSPLPSQPPPPPPANGSAASSCARRCAAQRSRVASTIASSCSLVNWCRKGQLAVLHAPRTNHLQSAASLGAGGAGPPASAASHGTQSVSSTSRSHCHARSPRRVRAASSVPVKRRRAPSTRAVALS
mmetsp:Transcript_1278/g.4122  ORF Transcript_1278/g.4122 Transcript_1278/m.4122 type:complete len:318 (-) Transcript_1278:175-1128(-)